MSVGLKFGMLVADSPSQLIFVYTTPSVLHEIVHYSRFDQNSFSFVIPPWDDSF